MHVNLNAPAFLTPPSCLAPLQTVQPADNRQRPPSDCLSSLPCSTWFCRKVNRRHRHTTSGHQPLTTASISQRTSLHVMLHPTSLHLLLAVSSLSSMTTSLVSPPSLPRQLLLQIQPWHQHRCRPFGDIVSLRAQARGTTNAVKSSPAVETDYVSLHYH